MAKYDDLDNKQIFVIGIGSVAVTVVTILAVFYVYYLLLDLNQATWQANSSYARQNAILAKQSESLDGYGATNSATVAIPIESAMKLVVEKSATPAGESSDPAPGDMPAEPQPPAPAETTKIEKPESPETTKPETVPVESEKPAVEKPAETAPPEQPAEPETAPSDPPESAIE